MSLLKSGIALVWAEATNSDTEFPNSEHAFKDLNISEDPL